MNSGQQLIKQFVRDMTHVRTHNSATFFLTEFARIFSANIQDKFPIKIQCNTRNVTHLLFYIHIYM